MTVPGELMITALPSRESRSTPCAPVVVLDVRSVVGAGGGPEKTILNSPRFLDRSGYRTVCTYLRDPNNSQFEVIRRDAASRGVELVELDDHGRYDWRLVRRLLAICRRYRPTVWHGHEYKTNALGLLLSRFWPMRLVSTMHGWVEQTSWTSLYYGIDRFALRRYEAVVCVSDDIYQLCRSFGVPAERCHLIENGIDASDYVRRQSVGAAKRRLGLDPDRLAVGAVGRLSPEKGFDLLIRAAAQLIHGGTDLDIAIAGEGAEGPRLQALAAELGIASRLRLLGHVADPRPVYEALDVFALSSRREGLPNVVLEAMALEVPVLATRVNGVPRLVRAGVNGFVVAPESVDELAGGLSRLLGDAELRARLAAAGRRTVEGEFAFATRMNKVRAVYDALLGRNSHTLRNAHP